MIEFFYFFLFYISNFPLCWLRRTKESMKSDIIKFFLFLIQILVFTLFYKFCATVYNNVMKLFIEMK